MNATATRRDRPKPKGSHHGRTPAAWTASVTAIVGFAVVCVGMVVGPGEFPSVNWTIVWVGAAILVVAPLAGGILNRVGMGQD